MLHWVSKALGCSEGSKAPAAAADTHSTWELAWSVFINTGARFYVPAWKPANITNGNMLCVCLLTVCVDHAGLVRSSPLMCLLQWVGRCHVLFMVLHQVVQVCREEGGREERKRGKRLGTSGWGEPFCSCRCAGRGGEGVKGLGTAVGGLQLARRLWFLGDHDGMGSNRKKAEQAAACLVVQHGWKNTQYERVLLCLTWFSACAQPLLHACWLCVCRFRALGLGL